MSENKLKTLNWHLKWWRCLIKMRGKISKTNENLLWVLRSTNNYDFFFVWVEELQSDTIRTTVCKRLANQKGCTGFFFCSAHTYQHKNGTWVKTYTKFCTGAEQLYQPWCKICWLFSPILATVTTNCWPPSFPTTNRWPGYFPNNQSLITVVPNNQSLIIIFPQWLIAHLHGSQRPITDHHFPNK